MRRVRVIKRERLLLKIENVHQAAIGAKALSRVSDHCSSDRVTVEAADDREDVQWSILHAQRIMESVGELNGLI